MLQTTLAIKNPSPMTDSGALPSKPELFWENVQVFSAPAHFLGTTKPTTCDRMRQGKSSQKSKVFSFLEQNVNYPPLSK